MTQFSKPRGSGLAANLGPRSLNPDTHGPPNADEQPLDLGLKVLGVAIIARRKVGMRTPI